MSYTIEKLDHKPAIVTTFNTDFDAATELEPVIVELRQKLIEQASPVYVIMDFEQYNISLNDLFIGTGVGVRNRDTSEDTPHRNKTIKTIIISQQRLIQASIQGFERFGLGKNLDVVATLEDALKLIDDAA